MSPPKVSRALLARVRYDYRKEHDADLEALCALAEACLDAETQAIDGEPIPALLWSEEHWSAERADSEEMRDNPKYAKQRDTWEREATEKATAQHALARIRALIETDPAPPATQ